MSISAWYLLKHKHENFARRSFSGALIFATIASLGALFTARVAPIGIEGASGRDNASRTGQLMSQPTAALQNADIRKNGWDSYAEWHLGLTEGREDNTKARYGFVFGDFRRIHRSAIIACHFRAAEWRHKAIELAAHELLQAIDRKSGLIE